MLSLRTSKKLEGISARSISEGKVNDLFKIMKSCPDLWKQAYLNIAPNDGAMTQGIDGFSIDGFSDEYILDMIKQLGDNRYVPKPVRRVYIPKSNGKKRPLGVPTFRDKLVQEVCRMLLEAVYEPVFSEASHGFRPGRSCHTALNSVTTWAGTVWFIEFDIKAFFDSINHQKLMEILSKKIDDRRFMKLISSMLTAGYMEEWKLIKTYSGTPQGGILSPLLANIFLNELDQKVANIPFSKGGNVRRINRKYGALRQRIEYRRKKVKALNQILAQGYRTAKGQDIAISDKEQEAMLAEINKLTSQIKDIKDQCHHVRSTDPFDPGFRRLRYVRYADDFLIGVTGTKEEADEIEQTVRDYVVNELGLEISEEKTGIRHARDEGARFLNYDIQRSTNRRLIRRVGRIVRNSGVAIKLKVPLDRVRKFSETYGNWELNKSHSRPELLQSSDVEIVHTFNAEFRGFANYYALAHDVKWKLHKLEWFVRDSFLRTLANKHQSTVSGIARMLRKDGELVVRSGKTGKEYKLYKLKHLSCPPMLSDKVQFRYSHATDLEARMQARKCEYCGATKGYFEVHHIRKLKDLKGKSDWEKFMIGKRRKTMVLCRKCHHALHKNKLPDLRNLNQNNGEPYASKGARTVRRGGKGDQNMAAPSLLYVWKPQGHVAIPKAARPSAKSLIPRSMFPNALRDRKDVFAFDFSKNASWKPYPHHGIFQRVRGGQHLRILYLLKDKKTTPARWKFQGQVEDVVDEYFDRYYDDDELDSFYWKQQSYATDFR